MEGPGFLKQKYDLQTAPEVEKAAERTEARTDKAVSQKPIERIGNYLDRFREIIDREDTDKRKIGMEALKKVLSEKFVIKPEAVPESAFLLEQRIAREQGHGDIEITDEFREQKTAQIVSDQTRSLYKWIDYLASPDAQYPDWAKYWAFRSMLEMGKLQKGEDSSGGETARFQKRDADTVASFPPLNPRALALAIGVLQSRLAEKAKSKDERKQVENKSVKLDDKAFQEMLSTESFSKIYSQFLIEMPEYSVEGLQEIRGKWTKYPQGTDAGPLVDSLEGYPLEWCTANLTTAQDQLKGGDFHVYYSINESGEALIPRVAIRMQGGSLAEVRGIASDQNLDPYITPVIESKMKEFPDGPAYEKKSADMKMLTAVEQKARKGIPFSKDDLVFLYEIHTPIEGFGYDKDPRITELLAARNSREDMPVVFDCRAEDIAERPEEVTANTKAYVGELFPGIFQKGIEHIYTSFPEGKLTKYDIEFGGKTKDQYDAELNTSRYYFSSDAKHIFKSDTWNPSNTTETAHLIRLTVKDMGFPNGATTDQIYEMADKLGLDLCPAETGPALRLSTDIKDWTVIGMKQISDADGYPRVFSLDGDGDRLYLDADGAEPEKSWLGDFRFVFRIRKSA